MNLPSSMQAALIDRDQGFTLKDAQAPLPQLGAHRVIDHSRPLAGQLPEAIRHPDGYLQELPPCMQPFGRIAGIAPLAAPADLNPLMQTSLPFHFTLLNDPPGVVKA